MSQDSHAGTPELKFFYAQLELLANLALGRNDHSIPVIRAKHVTWESCFRCLTVAWVTRMYLSVALA